MYQCQKCKKQITTCPACKYRIRDPKATLMNQAAGVLIFLTIIFVSLEIKVKEETEIAMKPFRQAQEETEKKEKVTEAGPPKQAKSSKDSDKKKNEKKRGGGTGKEGDFRTGTWGMLRSEIIEAEKAQKLELRNDPYNLDYLTKIGNFEVIAHYMFAQNRLSGGCYILTGQPLEGLDQIREKLKVKVGEPCPSWVKLDFSYYHEFSSPILNSIAAVDQFFYEMYISLASQMGPPEKTALEELENSFSRNEKVESVIAHERLIGYSWTTVRSKINFYFACLDSRPYFRLEYLSIKNADEEKP